MTNINKNQGDNGIEQDIIYCFREEITEYLKNLSQEQIAAIEDKARQGEPKAQYTISIAYREGLGVNVDPKKSHFYLVEAANNGLTEALPTLAQNYYVCGNYAVGDEILHKLVNSIVEKHAKTIRKELFNDLKTKMHNMSLAVRVAH